MTKNMHIPAFPKIFKNSSKKPQQNYVLNAIENVTKLIL